ncbi:hypothetical protein DD594_26225 [Enterobacter cloacae complex sp. 4DZ1-17B1]|nr:hypothetical protein DD594_26225 [Enterobacter cloacae complex sp. 4DZ1-17B1]
MLSDWSLEEDLANTPEILELHLEVFGLASTIPRVPNDQRVESGAAGTAQEGNHFAPLSQITQIE